MFGSRGKKKVGAVVAEEARKKRGRNKKIDRERDLYD